MSIRGKVENDIIKLPDGVHLPNGTEVIIEPIRRVLSDSDELPSKTFAESFGKYFGMIKDGPGDMAENHDHYLYGLPKKSR
jgi:hypothetical protein